MKSGGAGNLAQNFWSEIIAGNCPETVKSSGVVPFSPYQKKLRGEIIEPSSKQSAYIFDIHIVIENSYSISPIKEESKTVLLYHCLWQDKYGID